MSAVDTLVKAKQIIQERGVTREGDYVGEKDGSLCILGATYVAAGAKVVKEEGYTEEGDEDHTYNLEFKFDFDRNVFNKAEAILYEAAEGNGVTRINDGSETDEEVFEFFDKAIQLAKEME